MIKGFSQFINESSESSIETQLEVLQSLIDLGLIDRAEFRREATALRRAAMLSGEDIGSIFLPDEVKAALETPGARALLALGLEVSSSPLQLSRGNIVFAKPGYNRHTEYGIGFFGDVRRVRRMTPKRQEMHPGTYRNRISSMDDTIKIFPAEMSHPEFYTKAMQWAVDHLDFESRDFPAKHRTKKDYFNKFNT